MLCRSRLSRSTLSSAALVVVALSIAACSSADDATIGDGSAAAASSDGAMPSPSPSPPVGSPLPPAGPSAVTPDVPHPTGGTSGGAHPACAAALGNAVGDWSQFGNGQCLVGIQSFYPAKFGATIPIARNAQTGACAPQGACHIWLDDIPNAASWERIPNDGTALPSTYDVIVFGPTPGNPYGHIASVDRVEGGQIFIMDTNYNLDELKASAPHTTTLAAYGWYHLKKLPKTSWCSAIVLPPAIANQTCALGAGVYCGGDHLLGDPTTLYHCASGHVSVAAQCASTCKVMPDGQSDHCN